MSFVDICKNSDRWLNDRIQVLHLAGLRDTRFKDAQLMLFIHFPNAEGHANLGIIAFRTSYNIKIGLQQLMEPFLDYCFSIAPRYADHRYIELFTMKGGQLLEGF